MVIRPERGQQLRIDGILPAAGLATRMRGIPKFLLPCSDSYETLIERHLNELLNFCDYVWIPTRPEQILLMETLNITSDRVIVTPMTTETMTETVLKVAHISSASKFMLSMPDTYFLGETPYEWMAQDEADVSLGLWKIREEQKGKLGQVQINNAGEVLEVKDKDAECSWELSWGAITFSRRALKLANREMPHIGYLINPAISSGLKVSGKIISGQYFDCGTPREYLDMFSKTVSSN